MKHKKKKRKDQHIEVADSCDCQTTMKRPTASVTSLVLATVTSRSLHCLGSYTLGGIRYPHYILPRLIHIELRFQHGQFIGGPNG